MYLGNIELNNSKKKKSLSWSFSQICKQYTFAKATKNIKLLLEFKKYKVLSNNMTNV